MTLDNQHTRPSTQRTPKLVTLTLLCALSVLPLNVFLASLANIARDFQTDYALVSLSLAGYAAVAVVLELVMGPMSDRFGRRPIVIVSLVIFTVGSVGCALASNIWVFLAFRSLQASITSCYPVSMAIIRDTAGKEQTASRIGYAAMIWALAPMAGPALGGLVDEALGWRAIFWGLALAGIMMLTSCWLQLGETNKTRSGTITQQFRAYPALFRAPRFWAYGLCMGFSVGTVYAFLAGAPLVAAMFNVSPAALGLFIGSITAGFVFGSFLSGRYAGRYPLTTMMIAGRIVACSGPTICLILLFADVGNVVALLGPCILVGVGNGLTMPSANAGALSVRPDLAGSAAGLAGATTLAGGAILSWITGAVLTVGNAPYALLTIMLLSTVLALLAAVLAALAEKRSSLAAT
ncbi:Bcr/CflA family efflux MFS transporter [Agrobacterium tumefaciens]|uniref:Bcr/CflA family efflux MFS transporter n=1 Tax=Agrobacterium tumefaciens TaxID=358 RepID=UPI0009773706|nr:Bcr/CflA family drug resistance efflux transporter [Agrobacterium tumefaciens]